MRKEERFEQILAHFKAQMPEVSTELEFGSVFQLLVAVILSAQCTDKRINQVTPELFRRQGRPSGEDGEGTCRTS